MPDDKGIGMLPCVLKQKYKYYDVLPSKQKFQLFPPFTNLRKDERIRRLKRMTGDTVTHVDSDFVSVVGSVKSINSSDTEIKELKSKKPALPSLHMKKPEIT